MRALVIGYGSIGARHARILGELGNEVRVVTRRPQENLKYYITIVEAVADFNPEYVIIASRTSEHADDMAVLAGTGYSGILMIEKPLFDRALPIPENTFSKIYVGFNLRFHPALLRFKEILSDTKTFAVNAYAGQYLPNWRPGTDYRYGYSAQKSEGGGVLRDLSHELDYLNWLFGEWTAVTALGGQISNLELDSDDVFSLLFETSNCPIVTVSLNYLDSILRRDLLALTDKGSVHLDFATSVVTFNGQSERFDVARDDTFIAEHLAALGHDSGLCTLNEGMTVMKMIDACERAAAGHTWVFA